MASDKYIMVGKLSRLRRSQIPKTCPSSTTGVGNPAGDPGYEDPDDIFRHLGNLLDTANEEMLLRAVGKQERENMYCDVLTNGELPIGVCALRPIRVTWPFAQKFQPE